MITIQDLSHYKIRDQTLRSRWNRAQSNRSTYFFSYSGPQETGLLVFDNETESSIAHIYEIFVIPQFRRQGFATKLLRRATAHAIELNFKVLELKSQVLDYETDQSILDAWYYKLGFRQFGTHSRTLRKPLQDEIA